MTEITVDPMTNYQISWTKKKKKKIKIPPPATE